MTADPPAPANRGRPLLPIRLGRYAERWTRPIRNEARRLARGTRRPGAVPEGYDDGREIDHQWRWSACYAPHTSLYLDQFGVARACCQNTEHALGDITTSTLREIWDGAPAATLRRALEGADLGHGCDFCAWQVEESGPVGSFPRLYDERRAGPRPHPRWPRQLEFAVSNTCNLQCVMCNGDWSSAIRSRREHRAPLASAYPERFYEELVAFIPHLRHVTFTGGEPFLGTEPMRIMDLLATHGSADLAVVVVTNATTLTRRVERALGSVHPFVAVSLDGGTAEVYERIRVGASFDSVLANLDRLTELCSERGGTTNLTHCLMVDNWETFPELLQLAEGRGLEVAINTVRFPERHSLYHLPEGELRRVVEGLEDRTAEVEATVTGPRLATWHRQLGALRGRSGGGTWPEALGQPPVAVDPPRRR